MKAFILSIIVAFYLYPSDLTNTILYGNDLTITAYGETQSKREF